MQGRRAQLNALGGSAAHAPTALELLRTVTESPDFGNAFKENFQSFDEFLEKMTKNRRTNLDFLRNFENLGREKNVEFVDLVKRFPTRIWTRKSASIQPRTSLPKFEGWSTVSKNWTFGHSLLSRFA